MAVEIRKIETITDNSNSEIIYSIKTPSNTYRWYITEAEALELLAQLTEKLK